MKRMILILSLALALPFLVSAQDTTRKNDRTQVQKRDRIHQEDHLQLMDGKLYQFRMGERNEVKAQMKLKNGAVVNPDGSYQSQNGNRFQLQNGECMDMDGNRYLNQNRFNHRRYMNDRQVQKRQNNYNRRMGNQRGRRS